MSSRIKRRNKCCGEGGSLGTGERTDFNERHKLSIGGYGDWREYHKDYVYEYVYKQIYAKLKTVCPYGINPKRFGSKPYRKLILMLKTHEW